MSMRAEIIATGSELLSGGVVETNSVFLTEELLNIGIETAFKTIVADNEKDMEEVTLRARERADIVLITGGIGPTDDDITRKVIAKVLKKRLVLSEEALTMIKAVFGRRGRDYPGANDRQALIPGGTRLLRNPVGIAPGFYITEENRFLAVLPGVPVEMRAMFLEEVRPLLVELVGGRSFLRRKVLRTCGLSEPNVNDAIQDFMKQDEPHAGLTVTESGVDIRLVARGMGSERSQATIERAEVEIRKRLGDAVYGIDNQEIEEIVGALLAQRRLRIAIAESCTGGFISTRITNIAGSSGYFDSCVVAYSNNAKTELLGIPADLIEKHGAVSREVAAAMAQGIRNKAKTDLGLAVTGIAGPDGGSAEKPVGLVYIALAAAAGVKVDEYRFLGTRDQVRRRTAQLALDKVRKHLIA